MGGYPPPSDRHRPRRHPALKATEVEEVLVSRLVGGPRIVGTPDLVVEIHSPSTKVLELTEKRFVYSEAGIPSYWLVDPDGSTLTVLELRDGVYVEVAVIGAGESFDVSLPFATTLEGPLVFE